MTSRLVLRSCGTPVKWRHDWYYVPAVLQLNDVTSGTTLLHHSSYTLCTVLTLIPLTWKIWWAPNNVNRWQMRFNLALKGLKKHSRLKRQFQSHSGRSPTVVTISCYNSNNTDFLWSLTVTIIMMLVRHSVCHKLISLSPVCFSPILTYNKLISGNDFKSDI
jgi:hypothetical protein